MLEGVKSIEVVTEYPAARVSILGMLEGVKGATTVMAGILSVSILGILEGC